MHGSDSDYVVKFCNLKKDDLRFRLEANGGWRSTYHHGIQPHPLGPPQFAQMLRSQSKRPPHGHLRAGQEESFRVGYRNG